MVGSRPGLPMSLSIRLARPDDAARLLEMIHAFAQDVSEAAAATIDQIDRDAIGPSRLVETLLTESDGQVVGFVMFQRAFLSFAATRASTLPTSTSSPRIGAGESPAGPAVEVVGAVERDRGAGAHGRRSSRVGSQGHEEAAGEHTSHGSGHEAPFLGSCTRAS
jgi:hypothetical protein